jgi:Ice-binding-like
MAVAGRRGATLIALTIAAAALLMVGNTANAAIVPTVPLATSAKYAVLAGSTVTNTGPSVLNGSLGLSPGTSVTGFPPGLVVPPATKDITNAAAAQAQSDLTAAYTNALGRSVTATTKADLGGLTLQAGVYAGPSKGALQLTGKLLLDGAGNSSSVFIFQTNSSLTTATGSTVTVTNGALCSNIFWQVGSSATLGSGSVFSGTILALTSIFVDSSVTVHGRALARNAEVTLIDDTFTNTTTCAQTPPPVTTTTEETEVPGVVGPPKTGGPPAQGGSFPWLPVLFVSLLGGVGTLGTVLYGRVHSRGAALG